MGEAYVADLNKIAKDNVVWLKVLHTTPQQQITVMSIPAYMEIGEEVHKRSSQFTYIVEGNAVAIVGGEMYNLNKGYGIYIPKDTPHNIINQSAMSLKLYSIYTPPVHHAGEVQLYKRE